MMPPENADSSLKGLRIIFRSLQYRNYRLFFGGQSISLMGTWIQRIATPWLVYHLTNSPFLLGLVGFAGQIPTFILAPFAGVLTDRWNRYRILIATQVLAMVQALTLSYLYFDGSIHVWHIVFLNILLGCINAFDIPARQSLVIDMIEKKEDLGNAIALNSSMVNGARLVGPSVAGALIAATGEGVCFLLNGLSYFVVIISLLKMKISNRQSKKEKTHILKELKEGFSYTFGSLAIRNIILLLGLVSLMGMSYTVILPVFVKEVLHSGSHSFGFLMGASGAGAFSGAIYLASRKDIQQLWKIIPFSTIIFGLGLVLFSLSHVFIISLILMVIVGLGMVLQMASSNTILQTIVADDKRGRVMSFYSMAFMGTAPFGSLLSGGLTDLFGVKTTLIIGGISCILGGVVFAGKVRALRQGKV